MEEKFTLQNIIDALSEKNDISKKKADAFVRTMFEVVEQALAEDKYVKIKGFGTFKLTEVDSRESVDVNTGERIEIEGHAKVSFTPDTSMRELINKPFAHFETVILNEHTQLEDTETVDFQEILSEDERDASISDTVNAVQDTPQEVDNIVGEQSVEVKDVYEEETKQDSLHQQSDDEKPQQIIEEQVEINNSALCEQKEISNETSSQAKQEEVKDTIPSEVSDEDGRMNLLKIVIIGVITILIILSVYLSYILFFKKEEPPIIIIPPKSERTISTEDTDTVKTAVIVEDSITVDTIKKDVELEKKEQKVTQPIALLSDTVDYKISGDLTEHTLKPGETIVKLAKKFYGSKKLWPYIAKHNRNIIKDVDKVPVGTRLRIPKLEPRK